jgi:hypothetical protein
MPPTWELNVKPSFLTDLLALPNKKVARQVQQGVEALQNDLRPVLRHCPPRRQGVASTAEPGWVNEGSNAGRRRPYFTAAVPCM